MGIFSWLGSGRSADKPDRLRRWVTPTGHDDPKLDELKRAAAADVAEIEEQGRNVSPDAPGTQEDDL